MSTEYETSFWTGVIITPLVIAMIVGVVILRGWALSVVWAWTVVPIWEAAPITVAQGVGVSALASLLLGREYKAYKAGVAQDAHERRSAVELFVSIGGLGLLVFIAYVASRYYIGGGRRE